MRCKLPITLGCSTGQEKEIINQCNLKSAINTFNKVEIIVDAGIDKPSDATITTELGADGICSTRQLC